MYFWGGISMILEGNGKHFTTFLKRLVEFKFLATDY